jgi:hypothetical protein
MKFNIYNLIVEVPGMQLPLKKGAGGIFVQIVCKRKNASEITNPLKHEKSLEFLLRTIFLLPLLGFPISLRYIGINFSPNRVHKKTLSAAADRVLYCSPS